MSTLNLHTWCTPNVNNESLHLAHPKANKLVPESRFPKQQGSKPSWGMWPPTARLCAGNPLGKIVAKTIEIHGVVFLLIDPPWGSPFHNLEDPYS